MDQNGTIYFFFDFMNYFDKYMIVKDKYMKKLNPNFDVFLWKSHRNTAMTSEMNIESQARAQNEQLYKFS